MALNRVESNEERVTSAKIRCSFERWSGPAALLRGRDWMTMETSSGVIHSGSGLGAEEIIL